MRNYSTFLIVLITCGLVLGPLLSVFVGSAGYARWMLAQAANEFQRNQPELAEQTLKKAIASSSDIAADEEYWRIRFQLVFDKVSPDPQAISCLRDDAIQLLSLLEGEERYVSTVVVSNQFALNDMYEPAIDVLQTVYPQLEKRTAHLNNNVAYFRSLVKRDLPLALEEINASIQADFSASSLDTKAWILHGLNKNEEALKFANKGLELVYLQLEKGELSAFDPRVQDVSNTQEAKLLRLVFAPDITIPAKVPEKPKTVAEIRAQEEADLELILNGSDATPAESVTESEGAKREEATEGAVEPLDKIKIRYSSVPPELLSQIAKTIAVMRYHRSCILEELGKFDESERDLSWLELFGFNDTSKLK